MNTPAPEVLDAAARISEAGIVRSKSRTQEKRERNAEARRKRTMNVQHEIIWNKVQDADGVIHWSYGGMKKIYHERKVPGNYRTLWNHLNTIAKPNSKRTKTRIEEQIAIAQRSNEPGVTIIQAPADQRKGMIAQAKAKVKRLFNRKSS